MPTPLFKAVMRGKHEEARTLLDRGVQVNIGRGPSTSHPHPMSPLFLAVLMKDLRMVKLLLNKDTIMVDNSYDGMTPLAQAWAMWMYPSAPHDQEVMAPIIQALYQHGADIDTARRGFTEWCEKYGFEPGFDLPDLALLKRPGLPSGRTFAGALRL